MGLSFMMRFALPATAGRRHPVTGVSLQPGRHCPATGELPVGQLVHSDAVAPEQVVHDASQAAQPVSLVVVHTALSYCPAGQVAVQVVHAVLPVLDANVPAPQVGHDEAPGPGWYVPAAQLGQVVEPVAGWDEPAGQLIQVVLPDAGW
jgi:hypothetical protein